MAERVGSLGRSPLRTGRISRFWGTTLGKKIVMAITGIIMILFLIFHVIGNFFLFRGAEAMNGYRAFLHSQIGFLWAVRIILIVSLLLHILAASQLMAISRAARGHRYQTLVPQAATIASRSMRLSGLLIGAFIVFHILHFSTGSIRPEAYVAPDVYGNITRSFRVAWVSGLYLVAMIFVGLHLHQGAFGWFRTLGFRRRGPRPLSRPLAVLVAVFVWLGFSLIPVAVLTQSVR